LEIRVVRYNWPSARRGCWEFTIMGMLVVVAAGASLASGGVLHAPSFGIILIGMIYLIPGILFLIFAVFLKRRQPWAIVATMVMASLHALLALVGCVGSLLSGVHIIPAAICALWLAAMAQLIMHLSKSFDSIRTDAEYAPRGFEPLPFGTIQTPPPLQYPGDNPPGV
jgi:hypothetical protein